MPAAAWAVVQASGRMEQSWRRAVVRGVAKFVRFTSLLLLVITIPSGSIDISDIWVFSLFSIVPALLLLVMKAARLIQPAWVRLIARGVSGVLFGLATIVFVGLCVFETGCEARMKPIYSPDRRHLALVRVNRDTVIGTVWLRHSWRPIAKAVWEGYFVEDKLDIKWLDNSRLLIRHEHDPGHTVCDAGKTGEVEVTCEILPTQAR